MAARLSGPAWNLLHRSEISPEGIKSILDQWRDSKQTTFEAKLHIEKEFRRLLGSDEDLASMLPAIT
jgi:hypothetical protein